MIKASMLLCFYDRIQNDRSIEDFYIANHMGIHMNKASSFPSIIDLLTNPHSHPSSWSPPAPADKP